MLRRSDLETKGWLAVRKVEALKIDPETAEVHCRHVQILIRTVRSPTCRKNADT